MLGLLLFTPFNTVEGLNTIDSSKVVYRLACIRTYKKTECIVAICKEAVA